MFFGLNSVNLAILFLTADKLEPLKENELKLKVHMYLHVPKRTPRYQSDAWRYFLS